MPKIAKEEKVARKGRVTYVKTSKGLFPFSVLQGYALKKEGESPAESKRKSKQLRDLDQFVTDKNLIPHPFNAFELISLQENCTFFDACVRQIAEDVTGHGWSVQIKEGVIEETQQVDGEEVKPGDEPPLAPGIEALFDDPNTEDEMLDLDVMNRMVQDWGVIGWMCLEVSRDEAGVINGLYHIPAHTVWIHKEGDKYCQRRNVQYRWFKRFGYEQDVNYKTGEEKAGIPSEEKAHELIMVKNYYSRSSWYGAPNILAGVGAASILVGIRDYNMAFFENYGVPAAIVTLEGEWEEGSDKKISDFIDVELKRSENAHKTIVLELPEGGKVNWTPLIVDVKEGHFKMYSTTVRNEVLACYRMPAYRIGINEAGALGGSNSPEATRIYIDSIVSPLKRRCEFVMTRKIMVEGFGEKNHEFLLGEVDIRDINALTTRCAVLFDIGVLTRNEIRVKLGESPIDKKTGDPYIDTYYVKGVPVGEAVATDMMTETDAAINELNSKVTAIGEENKKKVPPTVVVDEDLIEEAENAV
jgi:PBSX family phage portal protein